MAIVKIKFVDKLAILEQFVTDYCRTPRTKGECLRGAMYAAYRVYITEQKLEDYELPINKFYYKMFGREEEVLERSGYSVPLPEFFQQHVIEDAEGKVARNDLYGMYFHHMKDQGAFGVKSQKAFANELKRLYPGMSTERDGQGIRYWTGIRLKSGE